MSGFAIAVLCVLIATIILYLMIVLGSFGVRLPKWITIFTGVFFILYAVFATIGLAVTKTLESVTLIIVILDLLLGIYALLIRKAPKRLRIIAGIITIIIIIMSIFACFLVPSMYGSTTLNMGLNGL